MAGNKRHMSRPFPSEGVKVTVADCCRSEPNFDLTLLGRINLQVFDR
jgi:hypothetical protein